MHAVFISEACIIGDCVPIGSYLMAQLFVLGSETPVKKRSTPKVCFCFSFFFLVKLIKITFCAVWVSLSPPTHFALS